MTASVSSAGARVIVFVCFSRRGHDWTNRVPLLAKALAALRVKSATFDGEGVVCREDDVSDFDRLRAAVGRMGSRDAFFCTRSIYSKLTVTTCDVTSGMCAVRRLRAFYAARGTAFNSPIISIALTARPCFSTFALWGSKASSPNVVIDRIDQDVRPIGSRSKTPTRRLRRG